MDRGAIFKKLAGKLKERKKLVLIATSVVALAGGGTALTVKILAKPAAEHAEASGEHKGEEKHVKAVTTEPPGRGNPVSRFLAVYVDAVESVQEKVDSLRRSELENERLKYENASLRLKLEARRFGCQGEDAAGRTRDMELKLSKETGAQVGRTLASISYRPPVHLLPAQLYTLGVTYLKAREDEKAAVILTFLTGLEDSDTFKTAKNYLMTGIAWYRLDNYTVAAEYFDRVLKPQESPEIMHYQAQARLWKALGAERSKQHHKAQQFLRDLVDHHPRSTEAAWVNSKEVERVPASARHESDEGED